MATACVWWTTPAPQRGKAIHPPQQLGKPPTPTLAARQNGLLKRHVGRGSRVPAQVRVGAIPTQTYNGAGQILADRGACARGRVAPVGHLLDVDACVQRIVERTDPDAVVLFGSRARGTHTADSDVDLLVVHAGPGLRRIQRAAYEAVSGHTIPLEIIVRSPEDLARRLADADPFTAGIIREGRVLYGKPRSRGVALFS